MIHTTVWLYTGIHCHLPSAVHFRKSSSAACAEHYLYITTLSTFANTNIYQVIYIFWYRFLLELLSVRPQQMTFQSLISLQLPLLCSKSPSKSLLSQLCMVLAPAYIYLNLWYTVGLYRTEWGHSQIVLNKDNIAVREIVPGWRFPMMYPYAIFTLPSSWAI